MQDDPCTFYWQEKLANSRTRSGRIIKPHYKEVTPAGGSYSLVALISRSDRLGALAPREHLHEVFRRDVDIDGFDMPAAVAGEARRLKRMRRDRDRGARTPIIRARIPGSAAVPCRRANPARATTGATSAARPGETHFHAADRRAFHQPRRLIPCQVFSKWSAAARIRADDGGRAGATMAALVSAGPSLGTGEAGAGRAGRQT